MITSELKKKAKIESNFTSKSLLKPYRSNYSEEGEPEDFLLKNQLIP